MQILDEREGLKAGLHGSVIVLHYLRTPTLLTAKVVEGVAQRALAQPSMNVGVLILMRAADRPPDSATREAIARLMKAREQQVHALAHVVLGDGFGAASLRAVLAGMHMLARTSYPVKVFSTVAEATAWLAAAAPRVLKPQDAAEMQAEVERFRAS